MSGEGARKKSFASPVKKFSVGKGGQDIKLFRQRGRQFL
jgi:hypothetical protein